MNKLTLPLSLMTLVQELDQRKSFTPTELVSLIHAANIRASELRQWERFDHNPTEGYGRSLVHQGEHYEIMVMSWSPSDYSAAHNHGHTTWGAVQVFGCIEHISYKLENNLVSIVEKERLEPNTVIAINEKLIHQMGNPSSESILSLHVYGTHEKVDCITGDSSLFEIGKHEIQFTNGGAFYDLSSEEILHRKPSLTADPLTEIHHFTQLLNLYHKSNYRGPQYNKAVSYFQSRSFENKFSFELDIDSKRVLYLIELKKAQELLKLLKEPTKIISDILSELNDFEIYS